MRKIVLTAATLTLLSGPAMAEWDWGGGASNPMGQSHRSEPYRSGNGNNGASGDRINALDVLMGVGRKLGFVSGGDSRKSSGADRSGSLGSIGAGAHMSDKARM